MNKDNNNTSMCKRTSDDSLYSDEDPAPNRITRRRRKPVKNDAGNICSPRLLAIAEPANGTFQHLYHRYGNIMEPQRASRIRRKLEDINLMTLEQLEAEINNHMTTAKENRQERKLRGKSFQEFSQKMIDQLFEVFATKFSKQIEKRQKEPICVTEATNKLIAYCQEIVENAVPKSRPRINLCSVSIRHKHSERTAKQLVAQVLALIAKRVYMDSAKLCNC